VKSPTQRPFNSNGAILYEGPSLLDGMPIVAIVTGLASASANGKTGAMLQTWILPRDVHPSRALDTGADASVCGRCPHRPQYACRDCGMIAFAEERDASGACCLCGSRRLKRMRSCYVRMQAPPSVWKAYKRGRYRRISDPRELAALGAGRAVRLGSYGDPAAVPFRVWQAFTARSASHTGYTHQRDAAGFDTRLLQLCMVSADRASDADEAHAMGARAFFVRPKGAPLPRGFGQCPAAAEAGRRVTCEACGLCGGSAVNARSMSIEAHGNGAAYVG
jgi:hypothetical protein